MTKPEFRVLPDADAAADAVATHLARKLALQPALRLGLATGNTFVPIYAALVDQYKAGGFSFARAMSFNLDEYVGLPKGHESSFHAYMRRHLFDHVDLPEGSGLLPRVEGEIERACRDYEDDIAAAGGIDLQVLGIGRNGHIGFNEPGSAFDSRTRQVQLTLSTREANRRDFPPGQTAPPSAVTMGIGTILDAHEIVLVALGANKAEALRSAFQSSPSPTCPASSLQSHGNIVIYCDKAALQEMAT